MVQRNTKHWLLSQGNVMSLLSIMKNLFRYFLEYVFWKRNTQLWCIIILIMDCENSFSISIRIISSDRGCHYSLVITCKLKGKQIRKLQQTITSSIFYLLIFRFIFLLVLLFKLLPSIWVVRMGQADSAMLLSRWITSRYLQDFESIIRIKSYHNHSTLFSTSRGEEWMPFLAIFILSLYYYLAI